MKKTFIFDLKTYAKENNIPIIQDEGLDFILQLIKDNNYKSVLEIGSAIGYSAINIALANTKVITIERDYFMYEKTLENIKLAEVESLVFPIYGDALSVDVSGKFDLIFIDAAKAQYIKFFEKFQKNLNEDGVIVCDNLDFHNLDPNKVSRNTRQLLKKIDKFKQYLKDHEQFDTKIYHIGDGISVSRRRKIWNI